MTDYSYTKRSETLLQIENVSFSHGPNSDFARCRFDRQKLGASRTATGTSRRFARPIGCRQNDAYCVCWPDSKRPTRARFASRMESQSRVDKSALWLSIIRLFAASNRAEQLNRRRKTGTIWADAKRATKRVELLDRFDLREQSEAISRRNCRAGSANASQSLNSSWAAMGFCCWTNRFRAWTSSRKTP